MKNRSYFLLAAFFMIGLATTQAQSYSTVAHYQGDGYDDYGDSYEVSRRYLDLFSRSDREYYYDLLDRLDRLEQKAWEDGGLSRKERNRIDDVLEDLDDLVYKYKRQYHSRYDDRRPYRPTYRSSGPALYIAAALLGRNGYNRGYNRGYRANYRSSYRSNNYRRSNNRRSRNRSRCY